LRALSLRNKLLLTYGFLILIAMSLFAGYFLYDSDRFYLRQATVDLRTQSYLLALQVRPLLATNDQEGLTKALREVNAGTRARFLVFDERGTLLAATEPTDAALIGTIPALPGVTDALDGRENSGQRTRPENDQEVLYVTTPVFASGAAGRVLGAVRVSYTLADMRSFERETLRQLLIAIALASALAALCGVFFARGIVRPLRAVRDTVNRLAGGDLGARIALVRRDEVGTVAADINTLGARLETLERQRREFTAEVSHDLRGLAAGIALTAQVLRRLGPERQERALRLLQALTEQTARLAHLTDELLLVASTEAAARPPARRPTALDALVAGVVAEMQPLARTRSIVLDYRLLSLPVLAPVDGPLFTRAIANLLDNAIAHTPEGGRIMVRLVAHAELVALSIADTGPGIAEEDWDDLFVPHYRDESSRKREGHGLGLAIVKRVIEAHGGEIRVASTPQGTTFTLLLPSCSVPPAA